MPNYLYFNPLTKETISVIQHMNDPHVFTQDGVVCERVFTIPRAAVDTTISDPFSQKEFMKRTQKTCKMGDLLDLSKELSERREAKAGVDPIAQKQFAEYEKKTKKKHPFDKPKRIETKNAILEL